jgi:hypothetical protein
VKARSMAVVLWTWETDVGTDGRSTAALRATCGCCQRWPVHPQTYSKSWQSHVHCNVRVPNCTGLLTRHGNSMLLQLYMFGSLTSEVSMLWVELQGHDSSHRLFYRLVHLSHGRVCKHNCGNASNKG